MCVCVCARAGMHFGTMFPTWLACLLGAYVHCTAAATDADAVTRPSARSRPERALVLGVLDVDLGVGGSAIQGRSPAAWQGFSLQCSE